MKGAQTYQDNHHKTDRNINYDNHNYTELNPLLRKSHEMSIYNEKNRHIYKMSVAILVLVIISTLLNILNVYISTRKTNLNIDGTSFLPTSKFLMLPPQQNNIDSISDTKDYIKSDLSKLIVDTKKNLDKIKINCIDISETIIPSREVIKKCLDPTLNVINYSKNILPKLEKIKKILFDSI